MGERAALLLAFAAACGSEPVYITASGMAVFIESDRLQADRDFEPLETALRIATDYLNAHVPDTKLNELLAVSELHLYSGKVKCGGEMKWGCYSEGGRIDAVGWTDCPTEWILDHELVHMAQEADGREQSHNGPMFGGDSWESELHELITAELRVCDNVPIY